MTTIKERLTTLIVEHLGVEVAKVQDDARLTDDLGADSLDKIELAMGVEEEFNITINDAEALALVNFGDIVKLVAHNTTALPQTN